MLGGESWLAQSAAYVIYPISLLTRIFPTIPTVLFLQSVALSLAVVPLFKIARNLGKLHFGTCTAVVAAYGTYVGIHNLNLSGFSPAILALPALFTLIYMGLNAQPKNNWRFYAAYVALILWILACRADLGLLLAGFGVLLFFEKSRSLKVSLTTFFFGFGWLLLAVLVVQTQLGEGYPAVQAFQSYGANPFSVVGGMFTNLGDVINDLRTAQNFESVVLLLGPLFFLPLIRPRYILPAIPLYFFYLIADFPEDILGEAEQTVPVTAFLFTAAVFALNRIGHVLVEKVRVNFYLVWILVLASAIFFITDAASSFYEEPWRWNDRSQAIEEVVDLVPDGASVRASSSLLTGLAEREQLYLLNTGSGDLATDVANATIATGGEIGEIDGGAGETRGTVRIAWVLVDSQTEYTQDPARLSAFGDELREQGWQLAIVRDGVFAYARP